MIIVCPGCEKRYKTDPKRIPPGGGFVRCPVCTTRILVRNESAPRSVAPEPRTGQRSGQTAPPAATPPEKRQSEPAPSPEPPPPADPPRRITTEAQAESAVPIHVLAEEGLLAARDTEELRSWISEGRMLRDNLVFIPGEEAKRADEHPLTQALFGDLAGDSEETEEKPEPPIAGQLLESATADLEEAPSGDPLDSAGPPEAAAQPESGAAPTFAAATVDEPWSAVAEKWPVLPSETVAEIEAESAAIGKPAVLPRGIRAIGAVNLVLSLTLPPNPLGVAAAVGLARGRAWGRALTTVWAGTQLFILLVAWSGLAALIAASGVTARPGGQVLPSEFGPLLYSALAFGALGAYFIVQWSYLASPRIAEAFKGGGDRAALWGGWIAGWLYIAAIAAGTLLLIPGLEPADLFGTGRETALAPAPAAQQARAPETLRVYSKDGRVSLEKQPAWSLKVVLGGDDAKLGLLLQGSRDNPAGKVRVSSARPRDVERMNKRFESIKADQETIRSVEAVTIGDLEGRRIVLWSKVPGGITGQILLSLQDGTRGYQFSCAAPGPGFEAIREACDRMAQSLIITREPRTSAGKGSSDSLPQP